LAWYFGEQIWKMVTWAEEHWYYAAIIIIAFLSLLLFGFKQMEKAILKDKRKKS
ncbi:DedA family protein, partial [Campylobacter jejuni]